VEPGNLLCPSLKNLVCLSLQRARGFDVTPTSDNPFEGFTFTENRFFQGAEVQAQAPNGQKEKKLELATKSPRRACKYIPCVLNFRAVLSRQC
jgi:hypothetical protein